MKNSRYRPALCRALTTLESIVTECRHSGENHLPRLRELTVAARVSQATMVKALRRFAASGLLLIRRGSGITLAPVTASRADIPYLADERKDIVAPRHEIKPRWLQVKERLSADLATQVYPPDSLLPPAKTLCALYGTSHLNLRRALRCLVEEHRLIPYKRTYQVTGPRPSGSRSKIAMVATMDLRELLAHLGPRANAFWRSMEHECHRLGLRLDIYDYRKSLATYPWPDGVTERLIDRIDLSPVLGFLVWGFALKAEDVGRVVTMLSGTRKPVSVLCETWESSVEEYEKAVCKLPQARLFIVAMTGVCGERVGEYLLSLGHRRVAVFCPDRDTRGWKTRFEGIVRAYERAALPDSRVHLFVPSESPPSEMQPQLRILERYYRYSLRILRRLGGPQADSFRDNGLRPFVYARRIQAGLVAVFRKVVKEGGYTAWVGLSDLCARTALYFLRSVGVRVPEEISVVGFDNDSESFADGLTTYDFNMAGVVQAMLEHVVSYDERKPNGRRNCAIEIAGTVIPRQSTGRARE